LEQTIQIYLTIFIAIVFITLAGLWYLVPLIYGLPWIPADRKRIKRAMELAKLSPGEIFYDLGAGDGRVLTVAAGEFGAIAIGIEIGPVHCLIAWARALIKGLGKRVSIRWGDMYKTNFRNADVVFVYLTQKHANKIKPLLEFQLREGARVVTISSDLDGWEPSAMDSEYLIFLYRMPPITGGIGSFLAQGRDIGAQNQQNAEEDVV